MRISLVALSALSLVACTPKTEPTADAGKPLFACGSAQVDLKTDPAHCGFCNNKCAAAHGKNTCENGACKPSCDEGWTACGLPSAGCDRNLKRDPKACGACRTACAGAPCVNGACAEAPGVLAADVWGFGINVTDGAYLYLGQPNDTASWSRVKLADGAVENLNDKTSFSPAAFDGAFLYGCKGVHGDKPPPCELRKRKDNGPESVVATLPHVFYGKVLAVRDGTVYWARSIPDSFKDGKGPFGDIVSMDLATKKETVLATHQQAPQKIVVDDAAVYWVTSGVDKDNTGLLKVAKGGGDVVMLATLPVAGSLDLRGDTVFASSMDGLFRVPRAGGASELVLFGAPPTVKAQFPKAGVGGVAVVSDEVFWTVAAKDVMFTTVMRAKLP